jgi:hypothetical protein
MTTYALGQMKEVRLLGLTEAVSYIIQNLRRNEAQKSFVYRKIYDAYHHYL